MKLRVNDNGELEPRRDDREPRFYWIEWDDSDHEKDAMCDTIDGNLVPIVDEEAGGIVAYAIGAINATMIVKALRGV